VHVSDRLTAVGSGIDDQSKSRVAAAFRPESRRDVNQLAGERSAARRRVGDGIVMRDGEDEKMGRRLWVEVFDRDDPIVAIDFLRRYLPRRDLTKNTFAHQCVLIVKVHDFVVVFPAWSETRTVT